MSRHSTDLWIPHQVSGSLFVGNQERVEDYSNNLFVLLVVTTPDSWPRQFLSEGKSQDMSRVRVPTWLVLLQLHGHHNISLDGSF